MISKVLTTTLSLALGSSIVNHSTDLYLLDQEGELVRTFGYNDGIQLIVDGIHPLLK